MIIKRRTLSDSESIEELCDRFMYTALGLLLGEWRDKPGMRPIQCEYVISEEIYQLIKGNDMTREIGRRISECLFSIASVSFQSLRDGLDTLTANISWGEESNGNRGILIQVECHE